MDVIRGVPIFKNIDFRMSLFAKTNGLILILFIPIVVMYSYSNEVTQRVLSRELKMSNAKQLSFLSGQIDSRVEQMMDFALTFSKDPNVRKFNGLSIEENAYDRMQMRYAVQEKIFLQSGVQNIWPVTYNVFSQNNRDVISNINPLAVYDEAYLKKNVTSRWVYRQAGSPEGTGAFYWYMTDSFDGLGRLGGSNLIIESSFGDGNIQNMLDQFKTGGHGDPFFYQSGHDPIVNRSADKPLIMELIRQLERSSLADSAQQIVKLRHKKYLISMEKSPHLGWYLVDYVPLDQVLGPISSTRDIFYCSLAVLFCIGISASVLLYRHVQRPVKKLIAGLQNVRKGNYAVRITSRAHNEFSFLYQRFNQMSEQIQDLIENVYKEKLRAREATLKQLQAQINPHFLYNCLGFIINMAQMKNEQAVVSMAYNLSAYYRYMTRLENDTATVEEEIQLLVKYLDIQKMRNRRIRYQIEIPVEMSSLRIPRLMLQPIVENAVIHGVGKSYTSGEIRISGEMSEGFCSLWIDDDGSGMNPQELEELKRKIAEPLKEEMGCGLWNVHQRMMHEFGEGSGLRFSKSPLGGLRVRVGWKSGAEDDILLSPNQKGA